MRERKRERKTSVREIWMIAALEKACWRSLLEKGIEREGDRGKG